LVIPYPAKTWQQATLLVGDPSLARPWYNDFCLIQDATGHWHCIGIVVEGTSDKDLRQNRLFHYIADSVSGPYHSIDYVDFGYARAANVWAPFAIPNERGTLMFYHYHDNPTYEKSSIRVAEADDAALKSWRRLKVGREVLFEEPFARDPHVIRDPRRGGYLMYYVCGTRCAPDPENVVRVRSSHDLYSWSAPRTVLGTPPGYTAAESVFVLSENGYYYMWISGYDYSRMSLYISTDPFDFGDATTNRIEEQACHASEVVYADGKYWIACVQIATDHNSALNGVFIPDAVKLVVA
jgi:hypothetical protein